MYSSKVLARQARIRISSMLDLGYSFSHLALFSWSVRCCNASFSVYIVDSCSDRRMRVKEDSSILLFS